MSLLSDTFFEKMKEDFLSREIYISQNKATGLYVIWDENDESLYAIGDTKEEAYQELIEKYLQNLFKRIF